MKLSKPFRPDIQYGVVKDFTYKFAGKEYEVKKGEVISSNKFANMQYESNLKELDDVVTFYPENVCYECRGFTHEEHTQQTMGYIFTQGMKTCGICKDSKTDADFVVRRID